MIYSDDDLKNAVSMVLKVCAEMLREASYDGAELLDELTAEEILDKAAYFNTTGKLRDK